MSEPIETQAMTNGATRHAMPRVPPPPPPQRVRADRQFSIKRTKSEIGFVYWILEGYGKHKCFVLCDSWDEAMEQAQSRLRSAREDSEQFLFADGL